MSANELATVNQEPENSMVPNKEVLPVWETRDTVFAFVTAAVSVIFVFLALFGGMAIGYTISFILLFSLVTVYLFKTKKAFTPFSVFCGAASILLSAVLTIYNNKASNKLMFAADLVLLIIYLTVSFTGGNNVIKNAVNTVVFRPFENLGGMFKSYGNYCNENNKKGPNKQILIGLAISVPILAVVLPLLINSDAAFEGLMNKLFSNTIATILKIVLGLALGLYIFSLLFAVSKKTDETFEASNKQRRGFSQITAVTVLSVISLFYAIYLFSQLAYFFSAFSGILPEDYTFTLADYARRGFFELCGVCSINLVVLALILGFVARKDNNKNYMGVKITATMICTFSLVFAATAISKMVLYISNFGLTRLRLETSAFMVCLILLFIGAAIFVYVRKFPVFKYAVVACTVILLVVGFADVDRTVAQYNVYAYNSGIIKEMDVDYLCTLSDSAVPYVEKLLDCKEGAVRRKAQKKFCTLAERYYNITYVSLEEKERPEWQSFNFAEYNAKQILLKNEYLILETAKDMQRLGEDY